jgi:NAD(P)-dependent dehydrogenase (short-subunit alcohol dehydrogenase family)
MHGVQGITTVHPAILSDKIILITGGGRGIGRAFALATAKKGATVVVTARSRDQLEATVSTIEQEGGRALALTCDVTVEADVISVIERVQQTLGPVDILINNAGVWGPIAKLWEVDTTAWWKTMEIHVRGSLLFSHAVLPTMISQKKGCIINIVSHAGVHRWPTCSAYAVSKAAVIKLTENLAAETHKYGISIFAAHPGIVTTGLTDEAINMDAPMDSDAGKAALWIRHEVLNGNAVGPEEAAAFIVNLASGAADALSGRYITVHDDLEFLISHGSEIQERDLFTLKLRTFE